MKNDLRVSMAKGYVGGKFNNSKERRRGPSLREWQKRTQSKGVAVGEGEGQDLKLHQKV